MSPTSPSPKTQDQLLAELDAAVHPNGPLGKTTAPGLRAFLASLVADVVARSAGTGTTGTGTTGTGTTGTGGGTGTGGTTGAVLASPEGLLYRLTVADDGTLGAVPADGLPLPDPQAVLASPQGLLYRLTVAADGTLGTLPAAGQLDPDAGAFIAAAGLRSAAHQLAVQALVRALKVGGVWPLLRAVYPMVGGTEQAHRLNLKDPRPVPEAFALQFVNNPLHNANGVQWNGADQYADTGFVAGTEFGANSAHLAYYATTDSTASVQVELGCSDAQGNYGQGSAYFGLLLRYGADNPHAYADGAGFSLIGPALPSGLGLGLSSYEPTGTATYYRDGRVQASAPTSTTWKYPAAPVRLGARQDGYFSQKACGFASLGAGLTPAQVAAYTEAIGAFQRALGRETAFDADALAFCTAAGLLDGAAPVALHDLVRALKASGVWPLLRAAYPMTGGTARAHALNLKDPRDADSAFRLQFVNDPQHTARGVEWNGTSSYANSFLVPSEHLDPTSHHLAYYAATDSDPTSVRVEMGALNGGSLTLLMRHRAYDQGAYFESFGTSQYSEGLGHGLGFALAVRESLDTVALYRDGRPLTLRGTTNPNLNSPNSPLWLGGRQDGLFSDKVCAFASIGQGLTPAQASAYAAAVRAFQQALRRDVALPESLLLA